MAKRYVWAVNYATEVDWECVRDDGCDLESLAQPTCLPQLFATMQEALDAGVASWKEDESQLYEDEEEQAEWRETLDRVRYQDDATGQRTVMDGEDVMALVIARELTLPE